MCQTKELQELINNGEIAEATARIERALLQRPNDANLLYLRGMLYFKEARWSDAMKNFIAAEKSDPSCPAAEARQMVSDIYNFYNKDLYNP